MRERYHESREQQMNKKIRGLEHFQHENATYQRHESTPMEKGLKQAAAHSSLQLLAYQIYHKKGGSALDNWLEAERILKDNRHT